MNTKTGQMHDVPAIRESRFSLTALIIAILLPLIVGGISTGLTSKEMLSYATMAKPPLSPPSNVFSVVWIILFIMMGLASYFVYTANAEWSEKMPALILYLLQLVMNFCWPFVFFTLDLYLVSFIWLVVTEAVIVCCTIRFSRMSKLAMWLMIPLILWTAFAAYLNLGVFLIN